MSFNNQGIYLARRAEQEVRDSLARNPVTALIGPRQCGKSTLARRLVAGRRDTVFLDLELPSDQRKLAEPEWFLREQTEKLVCVDEAQTRPDLFPLLRALVDADRRPGRFLLLGSASRDLLRQGGETLAGRIHYVELTPFLWPELAKTAKTHRWTFKRHWWRGGFPPAFLEPDEQQSLTWRRDMIQDYLSRDIPLCGFAIAAPTLLRFWKMLAHYHGQTLNASKLGQALDASHVTVRRYLDILEQTFMVRLLRPLATNLKKRLVKSPKVYLRDSGLLHALLELETPEALFGHPAFGASWEGWVIEQIVAAMPAWRPGFYRTASGEEIDLVLERGPRRRVFEIKASLSPHLSKGFAATLDVLQPESAWVVCPTADPGYPTTRQARVVGIAECLREMGT